MLGLTQPRAAIAPRATATRCEHGPGLLRPTNPWGPARSQRDRVGECAGAHHPGRRAISYSRAAAYLLTIALFIAAGSLIIRGDPAGVIRVVKPQARATSRGGAPSSLKGRRFRPGGHRPRFQAIPRGGRPDAVRGVSRTIADQALSTTAPSDGPISRPPPTVS